MKVKRKHIHLFIISALAVFLFTPQTINAAPPPGFEVQTVASGLNLPTAIRFAPDGRIFVAEKAGVVRIIKNGVLQSTPFIDLGDVNDYGDRGLLSIELDPDFSMNGYVYLLYTFENNPANYEGPKTGRLVRVTASGDTAVSGSEVVLLGTVGGDASAPSCENQPVGADCIPSDGSSHTVADVRFGPDGKIYVSTGDAASFDVVDPLAHRAQNLESLAGKVLRINPDGTAPADNPFYTGDSTANRSKVFAYGFRNPFRFEFRPANGSLYLGDVGWFSWEEVNNVIAGGNYGWPCREGAVQNPGGYNCAVENPVDPLYAYAHDVNGAGSVTGGVFIPGGSYPAEFADTYLFGDFAQNWIKRLVVDTGDNLISVEDFMDDAGGPVAFEVDSDGNINYLSIYTGELRKIVSVEGNRNPIAAASASPISGLAPLGVAFSSASSTDPDGDPLTFLWDFGNGASSTDPNPTYTYAADGTYTATLTAEDGNGGSDTDAVTIIVGNLSPTAEIVNPPNNSFYSPGQIIPLEGNGTDPEDGALPDSAYEWQITIQHNTHIHFYQTLTGKNPSFVGPDDGTMEGVYVKVELTVTDSVGLTDTASIDMYPAPPQSVDPYHVQTTVSPSSLVVGEPLTITTLVGNRGAPDPILVDIEVFDGAGQKIAQAFYDNEIIGTNEAATYTLDWTPTEAGAYRAAVGLIFAGWQGLYEWTNEATLFTVTDTPTTGTIGSLEFDGVDDYVDTEWWDIEEPQGFTLEARFTADTVDGDSYFIAKAAGTSTPDYDWFFGLREVSPTEATLVFMLEADGVEAELTGGSVLPGEFVHASAVYDNTTMRIYKNGMEVASQPMTGVVAKSGNVVWLGNAPNDPAVGAFDGTFDEVRVWNEPQSAEEILQFQGELTQKEFGLIKDWRFNEGFGQFAIDSSNSGHHGILGSTTSTDVNDPTFIGGLYAPGGTFSPTHVGTVVSPSSLAAGGTTTITTTVRNAGDGAGFMIVNIEVTDESGAQVYQAFFDGEGFAPGETREFSTEWTPAADGTYGISIGLVKLFWEDIYEWTTDALSITVTSTTAGPVLPVHSGTAVGPNPVPVGGAATIATDITNTGGAGNVLVNMEVYDAGVKVAQEFYDNEPFAAGETRQFTMTFTPTHEGGYGVAVGLFEPGWTGMYEWIADAASFSAEVASSTPSGVPIYDDALAPGWTSWSWDTTVDFAHTATVFSGTSAIEATYGAPWAGVYLHHDGFDTTGFGVLTFAIHGGSVGGQGLQVRPYDASFAELPALPLSNYLPGGTPAAGNWTEVSIPLSDLGIADAVFSGFVVQGTTGEIEPTFYLDDIALE